jgi:hypothetical protein
MSVVPQKKKAASAAFDLCFNSVPSNGSLGAGSVLVIEFLDTAGGIHDLLCAGVERVALGTHFDVQCRFAQCGAGAELVAAAASDCNFVVCGVDGCSHFMFLTKVGRGGCTRIDTNKGAHYP